MNAHSQTTTNRLMQNFYSGLRAFRAAADEAFAGNTTQAERDALGYRPTDWDGLYRPEMGESPEKARRAGIAAAKEILG